MSRADLLYEALKDGHRKSRHEIFRDAGAYFMTNNAAAELRAQLAPAGLDVRHTRVGRTDCYELVPLRRTGGVHRMDPTPPVSRNGASRSDLPPEPSSPVAGPGAALSLFDESEAAA